MYYEFRVNFTDSVHNSPQLTQPDQNQLYPLLAKIYGHIRKCINTALSNRKKALIEAVSLADIHKLKQEIHCCNLLIELLPTQYFYAIKSDRKGL